MGSRVAWVRDCTCCTCPSWPLNQSILLALSHMTVLLLCWACTAHLSDLISPPRS